MNVLAHTGICRKRPAPARGAALVLAAALATGPAMAQTVDYAALEALFGEPVTTSVTGSPQRASQVAATMVILTAEDIRRSGARDIPSVLARIPGLDVMQTTRDHWDVSIRGYNEPFAPRLLVLVDGRQVYADYYGFTPWSTIPVELAAIRQIEVVKGPNSALFGFNAVGGVVNIVTYGPLDEQVGELSVTTGSQDHAEASLVTNWRLGETLGLRLSAGHSENDDFATDIDPADVGVRRDNERSAASLALAWQATGHLRLGLEATWSETAEPVFAPLYRLVYDDYETDSLKAFLAADTRLGLIQATAYTNRITADAYTGSAPTPGLTPDNRVNVLQLESITKLAAAHTLRLSAEYRHNQVETTRFAGGEVSYDVAAAGTMWEWRMAPALTLTTALRLDRWELERSGPVPAGYPLANEDWNRSETEFSFNAGLVWQATDADTIRVLLGRGIQVPNLLALGGLLLKLPFDTYATGVPDLKPTVVSSYELSWNRAFEGLGGGLRLSLFGGRSRNVLANAGDSRPMEGLFGLPGNIGDSRTVGVAAEISGTFREDWRWSLGYNGQAVNDDFEPGYSPATTLVAFEETTPHHTFLSSLGWTRGPWEVDGLVTYRSRFDGFRRLPGPTTLGELVTIPGFFSVSGRLAYAINDRLTLAVSGQNLNRDEQRQTSAPEVERTVYATLSVDFGGRR